MDNSLINNIIQIGVLFIGIITLYLAIKKSNKKVVADLCEDIQAKERIKNDIIVLRLRIESIETAKKEEYLELKQMLKDLNDKFQKHLEKHGEK